MRLASIAVAIEGFRMPFNGALMVLNSGYLGYIEG